MKVRFLTLAQQELDDAVAWYNEQAAGLGQEFLDELDRVVRRVVTFPMSCALDHAIVARKEHYGSQEAGVIR